MLESRFEADPEVPWDVCWPVPGSCAAKKPDLECSLAPPMCNQVLWRQPQTVDYLKLPTSFQEANVDSFWQWIAPKYLTGSLEPAYKAVRLSQHKSRIQRETPSGTKLCWEKLYFAFFYSFLFYCFVIIIFSIFLSYPLFFLSAFYSLFHSPFSSFFLFIQRT